MRKSISAGHVTFVAEFLKTQRLDRQRTVHRADGRHIEQRHLALPLFVEQFAPAFDGAARRLGVVTKEIGIVARGGHDDIAGRPLHFGALLVAPHRLIRGRALPDVRLRCQLSGLCEIGDLVPVLDPLGVDGLKRLGRAQQGQVVVVPLTDVVLVNYNSATY